MKYCTGIILWRAMRLFMWPHIHESYHCLIIHYHYGQLNFPFPINFTNMLLRLKFDSQHPNTLIVWPERGGSASPIWKKLSLHYITSLKLPQPQKAFCSQGSRPCLNQEGGRKSKMVYQNYNKLSDSTIFCAACIVQQHGKRSRIKQSFVKFPLPENAIRGLFSHHKIKTALEDGVRPGTGMKKRIDQRVRQKKTRENKPVC